jgi:hypothetical protein
VNNIVGGSAALGTISATGVYTAPTSMPNPNTVTVTATSVSDHTKSAAVMVVVTNAVSVTGLSVSSTQPFNLLTISGSAFDQDAVASVQFFNSTGYAVDVPPVALSSTSITVSVPPFINQTTGAFDTATVSVKVTITTGIGTFISNSLSGLQIQSLPIPATSGGKVALKFLMGVKDEVVNLQMRIQGSVFDTPQINAALSSRLSNLGTLIPLVNAVVQDPTQSFTLGSVSGNTLIVGSASLSNLDRLILGMLKAQADFPAVSNAVRTQAQTAAWPLAASSGACASQETNAYLNALLTDLDLAEPARQNMNNARLTCLAPAINTSYEIVSGAGGVGLGLLSLAGAPAMATALASSALLYVTTTISATDIALAGALGQSSSAGRSLIQDGVKRLEDLLFVPFHMILSEISKTVGTLWDLYHDALIDAFTGAQAPQTCTIAQVNAWNQACLDTYTTVSNACSSLPTLIQQSQCLNAAIARWQSCNNSCIP